MHRVFSGVVYLVGVIAILNGSLAWADTYFIRMSGNDGNNGTSPATAFATPEKIGEIVEAGDTVYFGAGVYSHKIEPKNSGTLANPIRFIADTDGSKTGDAGVVKLEMSGSPIFSIKDISYIVVEGFTIMKGQGPFYLDKASSIVIRDCSMWDSEKHGIEIKESSDVLIENCSIGHSREEGIWAEKSASLQIIGCEIKENKKKGIKIKKAGSSAIIDRCVLYKNGNHGLSVEENATVTVTNTLADQNNKDGFHTHKNCVLKIWNCTSVRNNDKGIKVHDGGTIEIVNTIVYGNKKEGVYIDSKKKKKKNKVNLTLHHNLSFGNMKGNWKGVSAGSTDLSVDPKFTSFTSYKLASDSPAINAGTSASAFTDHDLMKLSRPGGAGWDMGCHEGDGGQPAIYLFTDISVESGFGVNVGTGANGIQWGDLDNDGDLDAILTGTSAALLWNNPVAESFDAVAMGNMPRQGVMADFDNDGDLDYWHSSLVLWENLGIYGMSKRGTLGLFSPYNTESVAAIDIDADGRLDLVMPSQDGNWIGRNSDPGSESTTRIEFAESNDPADGLHVSGGYGNGDFCSTADVNNDGYLDLFYHYGDGELFLSNGDGTYTHLSTAIQAYINNNEKFGSAFGDYDNDGDMDLWVSRHTSGQPGYLWRNNGDSTFTEIASAAGLDDTGYQRGCSWGDYDNDGDLDLAIAREGQGVIVYSNDGDGTFTESFDFPTVSGATTDVCFVDINNDGNLDLSVTRENGSAAVLRNDIGSLDYLMVRFVGKRKVNGAGVGVRFELWDASDTTMIARREPGTARGYGGQEPLWAHFGGVAPSTTYTLRVYTPGTTTPTRVELRPDSVSTVFSGGVRSKFITVEEDTTRVRVVNWREIGSEHNR